MITSTALFRQISQGNRDGDLRQIYGDETQVLVHQRERYCDALLSFEKYYGAGRAVCVFSVPGRTELGGNNTDHQNGVALAAAVNLDIIAVVAPNGSNLIRVKSYGFNKLDVVDLNLARPVAEESTHSASLIRGIAVELSRRGGTVGGFDAYTTSDVLRGSGLSSSAAFEVMIITILNFLYSGGRISALEMAEISQYAENHYFGKPSGLLDPLTCALGGAIYADFAAKKTPEIRSLPLDLASAGYCLCITDTRGSHSELTPEFSAIRMEMESVSHYFGRSALREVQERQVFQEMPRLRKVCGDRAVLRALHFFSECQRVYQEYDSLKQQDFQRFLELVRDSGHSAVEYAQNAYCTAQPQQQPLSVALALSASILRGQGASRLQGTGFAGTIQAFVPNDKVDDYCRRIDRIFGAGSCQAVSVRNEGSFQMFV